MALLELHDLHTYFKTKRGIVKAVNGVSYQVEAGKTLGVVGESGSGKSVSAMSILKLLDGNGYIAGGDIFFKGQNLKDCSMDEMYKTNLSNKDIYDEVCKLGYVKAHITADSAEPKSIKELKGLGLNIEGAKKGRDSVNNGIQWIKDLHIVVHPRCVNFLTEISNYCWAEDKFGKKINTPIDDFNHLMDAMRYALEKYIIKSRWIV